MMKVQGRNFLSATSGYSWIITYKNQLLHPKIIEMNEYERNASVLPKTLESSEGSKCVCLYVSLNKLTFFKPEKSFLSGQ